MDKHSITDVFTPTKSARISFVERDSINTKFVNALQTPGKQLVVYGHSGSGKTTLIENKLCQLYENHITTRCVSGMTFDQILRDAFDQLGHFYDSTVTNTHSSSVSGTIGAEYRSIKAQIDVRSSTETTVEQTRLLPPQLTPQRLGQYIGAAKCCWVLDDFHKISDDHKKQLSQTMKAFMDIANDWPTLKIIAIGAVDTARQVVQYDAEMTNRVSEIEVPLMSTTELRSILSKGEELLNITISPDVKREVLQLSNGLASVCHSLGLGACRALNLLETADEKIEVRESELQRAITDYLEDSSDSLKGIFDKALHRKKQGKFDNFRIVVEALSKIPQEGETQGEILQYIRTNHQGYPQSNLIYCLRELQTERRGELVRLDRNSGRYSFTNPFYRAYALALFQKSKTRPRVFVSHIDLIGTNVVTKFAGEVLLEWLTKKKSSDE
ncbi:MAG: ATP-binding protein [Nitrospira sp.]|nr:ATP-binding protein [Nitrospira sp.]